ncbi:GGDEF domain-containing protein [Salinicola halophilus]|uniref:GGDEF domain-containing protein n=1 Tax=Salinicola halophilus TaxID=184065 RepID=UPI0019550138|nr:GGDEF domain-containing protein [Salinicola halophilus]
MKTLFALHRVKLAGLAVAANLGLIAYLVAGEIKPVAIWSWMDVFGEGGSALLVLCWIVLLLKSRPGGRVTALLFAGLACLFFSLWMDTLDEFIKVPVSITWDKWLESGPMPIGFILITLGIYHWHREQLAISQQMEKREGAFREHRLFDRLTPLSGADYLRLELQQALKTAQEDGWPLSLVVIDLDEFGHFNRTHGYAEGDRVLQTLSQYLLLNLRRHDLLCRLAGDRFVILLPNTGEFQARQLAEALKQAVAAWAYHRDQDGERLRLSASAASVTAREEDAESVLQRLNRVLASTREPIRARRA